MKSCQIGDLGNPGWCWILPTWSVTREGVWQTLKVRLQCNMHDLSQCSVLNRSNTWLIAPLVSPKLDMCFYQHKKSSSPPLREREQVCDGRVALVAQWHRSQSSGHSWSQGSGHRSSKAQGHEHSRLESHQERKCQARARDCRLQILQHDHDHWYQGHWALTYKWRGSKGTSFLCLCF